MSVTVERCNTPGDVLHGLVRGGLTALQTQLQEADRWLPRFVTREVEGYLRCGDPREGFAWLRCGACDHHRLVPFTCKGRGFCPSCGGRRMADRAARWVDTLLPRVAVRQVVVTVPWPRRWLLARTPALARGVLAIALREVQRWLQRVGTGRRQGQTGSITVVQRFGSALNLNLHFHCLVLDRVYTEDRATGRVRWHRSRRWTTADVEGLVVRIADRAEAWLARQGFGRAGDGGRERGEEDALSVIQSASVAGRSAVGGGRRARRVQVLGGRPFQLPPLCASCDGYSVHAGVVIGARNRQGLEQLCRYIARPPLAKERVEALPGGRVRIELKRAWSDGTTALELSRLELVERLVSLVPPPRANQVHIRCGAARGAGVSVAASGSGSAEGSEGADASGECGAETVEAWAGSVALAVLERAALACVRRGWVCVPEVWGGDGASGGGAASGDASCVDVAGPVCAGSAVGGGVEPVA